MDFAESNKMIGSRNCPITDVRLQFCRLISANAAVYAPITFEEIVMIVINYLIR